VIEEMNVIVNDADPKAEIDGKKIVRVDISFAAEIDWDDPEADGEESEKNFNNDGDVNRSREYATNLCIAIPKI
jgi:hypothetical protein